MIPGIPDHRHLEHMITISGMRTGHHFGVSASAAIGCSDVFRWEMRSPLIDSGANSDLRTKRLIGKRQTIENEAVTLAAANAIPLLSVNHLLTTGLHREIGLGSME
jgi:hypothetical protein